METVADRIKALRKQLELTQEALGRMAGRSKSSVSQWERGETEPERDSLDALRIRKRVNPDWVTRGVGEMFLPTPADIAPPGSPERPEPTLTTLLDSLAARIARAHPAVRADVARLVLRYIETPEAGARIVTAIDALLAKDGPDDSATR